MSVFDTINYPLTRKQLECLHLEWEPTGRTNLICRLCDLEVKTREALDIYTRMGELEQ